MSRAILSVVVGLLVGSLARAEGEAVTASPTLQPGFCGGDEGCTAPCPALGGCEFDSDCGDGMICAECCELPEVICVPSFCTCHLASDDWGCTDDCIGLCVPDVPAASGWMLAILAAVLASVGAVILRRRRPATLAVVAFAVTGSTLAFASGDAAKHLVRVPAEAVGELDGLGFAQAQRMDYATFTWALLSEAELARLRTSGVPHDVRSEPYALRLGGLTFDPGAEGARPPDGWSDDGGIEPNLHLVQFVGPTRTEWIADLEQNGLILVSYVYPYTYVVWGRADDLPDAANTDFVRWTGPFVPAYRVVPHLRELEGSARESTVRKPLTNGGRCG